MLNVKEKMEMCQMNVELTLKMCSIVSHKTTVTNTVDIIT